MNPKLSIVIPTVNRSRLLERAVRSVLAQTSDEIEIIVSNNGSTDDTREVLATFADPRLRILHRDVTIDACSHGSALLELASGKFFLGLSDDDYIEPNFAAKVIDFFAAHPATSFVYTGCDIHYADVTVPAKLGPVSESGPRFLKAFLSGRRDVCWCACVTRTTDLRAIGPIPPGTICGDMFYWTKLAATGTVGCIQEPLSHYVAYRPDPDNHSSGTPVTIWARDVQNLTSFMVEVCSNAETDTQEVAAIRQLGQTFLARSTADQFVWNALRGAGRRSLLAAIYPALPLLSGGSPGMWLRIAATIAAAIVAPRRLLESRVLAVSRRKAESVRQQAPQQCTTP